MSPWERQSAWSVEVKRLKNLSANVYAENSVKAFLAGDAAGIVMSLKNPLGSRFWKLPCVKLLRDRVDAGTLWIAVTSYCRWGAEFRGTRWILVNRCKLLGLTKACIHEKHN